MDDVFRDLRFALRGLFKSPVFTVTAIVTLALGVGATTAMFSIVNSVLLRPLPYDQPERLVMVWSANEALGADTYVLSPPDFHDFKAQGEVFEELAAFTEDKFNLTGEGLPERVTVAQVSPGFLPVLGSSPATGRGFTADEDQEGKSQVAVLSHGFSLRRFGGPEAALGESVLLNDESYQVIGVMAQGFAFPDGEVDLWVPKTYRPVELTDRARGLRYLKSVGRLRPGVSLDRAQAQLDAVAARLAEEKPKNNEGWGVKVVSLHEQTVGEVRQTLMILLGAVGFLLLMACLNVASLLLVRAGAREREISVRTALGAGRGRLTRQLLTETVVLALLGSLGGLVLANLSLQLLVSNTLFQLPRLAEVSLDVPVLVFTLVLTVVIGLLFGLVPLRYATRLSLTSSLKDRGASAGGRDRQRLRGLLVTAQIAATVVLLVGSGLMIRTLSNLQSTDPGFQEENLLTTSIVMPEELGPERHLTLIQEMLGRLGTIPGVSHVAGTTTVPYGETEAVEMEFSLPERPDETLEAGYDSVTADYFATMGIPMLAGRPFTGEDHFGAPPVVIVNETMARLHWPGESPVGKFLTLGMPGEEPRQVVALVQDVRRFGLDTEARAEMYVPNTQHPWHLLSFVVRSEVPPATLAGQVREAVWEVNPDQPLSEIHTLQALVDRSLGDRKFSLLLLGAFAGLALLLAAVGCYGMMSYAVTQRSKEIGLRMALGAVSGSIVRMLVGQGLRVAIAGVVLGLAGAFVLVRWMSSLLYGVSGADPLTLSLMPMLLILVTLLATLIPASRATRVEPNIVLRDE